METDNIEKDLLENGIKDTITADIEREYNASFNEISADSSKANIARCLRLLYTSFKTASGNDKLLRKMYKDLKKKYVDQIKVNKNLTDTQKEEAKNMEIIQQKYNELVKAQMQAKEELRQKELAENEFTINEKKEENEIDENFLQELRINNEQLMAELIDSKNKSNEYMRQIGKMKSDIEKLNKLKKDLIFDKNELERKIVEENQVNKTEKESKDEELKRVRELMEGKSKDLKEKEKELIEANNKLKDKEQSIESFKKKVDNLITENKKLNLEKENDEKKIERISNEKKIIMEREREAIELLKKTSEDKDKIKKMSIQKENAINDKIKYIDNINKIVNDKNTEIEKQKIDLAELNKNIFGFKKEIEEKRQTLAKEIRNKEKVDAALKAQLEVNTKKDQQYLELNETYKRAMNSLDKSKKELNEMEKVYRELERARNKCTEENTKLKNKIDHLLEDIRLGDNRVQELQKKCAEYEKKMKMQREVYDAVRRDKNLYFKNLIETQDDLVERQNMLQFNKKEIENLKGDLKKKDDYIVDIKGKNTKFEKSLKTKESENNKLTEELDKKSKMCQAQEKEMEKLKINVEETSKNYNKLEGEYKKAIIDRDNLSSQLIRRNDEVSILHEKIMILTTDITKIEQKKQEKEDYINNQSRSIEGLKRDLAINMKFKEKAEAYSREIINLNKELLREKNLNKALTEEVESSEKLFHRWRKLEGIDPDSLELHYKISLLQKRLISKTEECVEKEITIQDLTKELANSKKLANKKPLFEIEESIKKYKQELSKQYERMKAIINELNIYRNQVEEYKSDNNRVKKENIELQNKYHELKIRANKMNI
jgi:chromosome segregation ATPase